MEKQSKIIKFSERFDKQLLNILSEELKALKKTGNHIVKTLKPGSDDDLLVA